MLTAHPWLSFALHTAIVADIAAAVSFGVSIDQLAVVTRLRHAQPVIIPNDWCRVHDKYNRLAGPRFAQKRDNAVIGIVKVVPFVPLTEFATHEEQFLAGLAAHPGVEHPQVGKLLPFVSRHL